MTFEAAVPKSPKSASTHAMLPRLFFLSAQAFVELSEQVVAGFTNVDYLAYAAIFSDPSGNVGRPGQTSKDYLEKCRKAVMSTLETYTRLLALLPGM